jgi:hypothetical protein
MGVDIQIDELTPCLVERETGNILSTVFKYASADELRGLKANGWNFNWTHPDLDGTNIYKVQIEGDNEIQGIIAAKVVKGAVYVPLVESAPHNLGKNKKYDGVGGHLFAIAIKLSVLNGFGGFIYFDAKNTELVEHYRKMLGAECLGFYHEYRMQVETEQALKILKEYTLKGEL